jgi:hypothetical protein
MIEDELKKKERLSEELMNKERELKKLELMISNLESIFATTK